MMSWYRKLAIVFTLIFGLAQVCEAACVLKSGNLYVCLNTDTKPVATQGTRVYAVDSVDPDIVKIYLCTAATCTVSDNWKMSGDGGGVGGGILSIVSGTNITVDSADPEHPIVSATTATTVTDHVNSTTLHVPNHESSFNHTLLHGNTNDPTADQKAALAGTYSSPSSTNKYITNADPRIARDLLNLMSTGIISGGMMSINTDTTKFDLSSGTGVVVNNYTDPTAPTKTDVAWSTQTAQVLTYLATSDETIVYVDSTGAIHQSTIVLTDEERRDNILIGTIGHYSREYINYVIPEAEYVGDVKANLTDFLENFGPFNITGNEFYACGANLTVCKSAGKTFDNAANYGNSRKSPNVWISNSLNTVTMQYYYRNGADWIFGDHDTTIDPNNYDSGAGIVSVPTGSWTIQPIFYYAPLDITNDNVDIQYGQVLYGSLAEAKSALSQQITVNPFLVYDTFRAWLIVQQGATALNNPAQAEFVPAGKLGLVSAASGGGVGGEVNTASSVGTTGESIYSGKVGVDLQFKSITAMSNKVAITDNAGTHSLDIDIEPANITHNDLASMQGGTVPDQYYHMTANQNAALAGTSGTPPSAANPYVDNDDTRLSTIGQATSLRIVGTEENVSAIVKGQVLSYVAGIETHIEFGLGNNTNTTHNRIAGIAENNCVQNSECVAVSGGILVGVDTRATNTWVNPNAETWALGDLLWMTTGGGMTNVRPTSGRNTKVGRTVKGNDASDSIIVLPFENPVWATAASGEGVVQRLGDNAGATKVSIRDYANNEVASINSDGGAIFTSVSGTGTVPLGGTTDQVLAKASNADRDLKWLTGTGGGAPIDGEYVTYSANGTLSAERVFNNGTNTTVDIATAGNIHIDLTGPIALSMITDDATATKPLMSGGGAGDPAWSTLNCSSGQAITSASGVESCTSTLTASDVSCSGTCVADSEISAVASSKLTTSDSTTTAIGKATPTAVVANICNAGSTDTCNTFRIAAHTHANATGAGGQIAASALTGNIITKGGTLISPSAAINVITWYAPFACTVTNVRGYRVGGTAATINARKNGTLNHLASALSLSSADTWMDGGSVQNTAYAAGDKLEIMLVTVTGATQIGIQVDFTRP